jgi:hypothetical protein
LLVKIATLLIHQDLANKRVESRTGAVALVFRWRITRLSLASPQSGLAWLCFLFPLIEPNRRVSRIRLSEKVSRGRPRKADRPPTKPDQPKLLMQGGFRILLGRRPSYLVLGTQPLPQASMSFYSSVGSADWSKTEIVNRGEVHRPLIVHNKMQIYSAFLSRLSFAVGKDWVGLMSCLRWSNGF